MVFHTPFYSCVIIRVTPHRTTHHRLLVKSNSFLNLTGNQKMIFLFFLCVLSVLDVVSSQTWSMSEQPFAGLPVTTGLFSVKTYDWAMVALTANQTFLCNYTSGAISNCRTMNIALNQGEFYSENQALYFAGVTAATVAAPQLRLFQLTMNTSGVFSQVIWSYTSTMNLRSLVFDYYHRFLAVIGLRELLLFDVATIRAPVLSDSIMFSVNNNASGPGGIDIHKNLVCYAVSGVSCHQLSGTQFVSKTAQTISPTISMRTIKIYDDIVIGLSSNGTLHIYGVPSLNEMRVLKLSSALLINCIRSSNSLVISDFGGNSLYVISINNLLNPTIALNRTLAGSSDIFMDKYRLYTISSGGLRSSGLVPPLGFNHFFANSESNLYGASINTLQSVTRSLDILQGNSVLLPATLAIDSYFSTVQITYMLSTNVTGYFAVESLSTGTWQFATQFNNLDLTNQKIRIRDLNLISQGIPSQIQFSATNGRGSQSLVVLSMSRLPCPFGNATCLSFTSFICEPPYTLNNKLDGCILCPDYASCTNMTITCNDGYTMTDGQCMKPVPVEEVSPLQKFINLIMGDTTYLLVFIIGSVCTVMALIVLCVMGYRRLSRSPENKPHQLEDVYPARHDKDKVRPIEDRGRQSRDRHSEGGRGGFRTRESNYNGRKLSEIRRSSETKDRRKPSNPENRRPNRRESAR